MRLGVLDIGSNTVHFLVVDAHPGAAPIPATSHKIELRLAEHLGADDRIDDAAVDALCDFVAESLTLAENLGVTEMTAFATSAVRDATNADSVIATIAERTGVRILPLAGAEEARLTFLAVRRWYGWSSGRLLVIDIGGGSLELASGDHESPDVAISLPLGAGRLTRDRVTSDPPSEQEVRDLRRFTRAGIADVLHRIGRSELPRRAVATSKTFRQLARIAGAAPSNDGPYVVRELQRADLSQWLPKLATMTATERSTLPGVSEGRAHQLVAGAIVAEAAMDLLDLPSVLIGPWALREGVLLQRLDQLSAAGPEQP